MPSTSYLLPAPVIATANAAKHGSRGLTLVELLVVVAIMTIIGFAMVVVMWAMAVGNTETVAMAQSMQELQPLYEAFAGLVRQASSDTDAGQVALNIVNSNTQLDVYQLVNPTDASTRTLLGRVYRNANGDVVVQRVLAPASTEVYLRNSIALRFDLGPTNIQGPADYGPWRLGVNRKAVLMTITLNVNDQPFVHKFLVAGPNIKAEN